MKDEEKILGHHCLFFCSASAWTNISRIHIGALLPEKITGIIEPTSQRGQTEIFDFFIGGGIWEGGDGGGWGGGAGEGVWGREEKLFLH